MAAAEPRRAVLITGASGGIGAAIARAFAGSGDRVAVHHHTGATRAQAVLASLPGEGHVLVQADITDPEAILAMVEQTPRSVASTCWSTTPVCARRTRSETRTTRPGSRRGTTPLAVNLVGAANVTWCAARHMGRGGRIVNVASRGAFRGEPRQPAYGASKTGLVAFGQSLARALGPRGIAVTSVAPGITDTEMAKEALAGAEAEGRRAESPLNGITSPDDVAAAVLYLASPAAEMASGTVLDLKRSVTPST